MTTTDALAKLPLARAGPEYPARILPPSAVWSHSSRPISSKGPEHAADSSGIAMLGAVGGLVDPQRPLLVLAGASEVAEIP